MAGPLTQREQEEMHRIAYEHHKYRQEKIMEPPPFTKFHDYERLAREIGPFHGGNMPMDLSQYAAHILATMDALKEVIGWIKAQTTMITEAYKDKPYERDLHLRVLQEGFKAILAKEKE